MKHDPLLYGVIGALVGGFAVWAISVNAVNNNMTGMMRMMGMGSGEMHGMGMGSSMNEMMVSL